MLRKTASGLISNSRSSRPSAARASQTSRPPGSTPAGSDVRSCGRKRARSPARTESMMTNPCDWNSAINEGSQCPECKDLLCCLRAEIVSLKRQLKKANSRLQELEGKGWGGCPRDTEGNVHVLKMRIEYLMSSGKITKDQVMRGKFDRKLLGNKTSCAHFQLALTDVQEEMRIKEQQRIKAEEAIAMEAHDRKGLVVLKSIPEANPEDIIDETTRQLVECYVQTWESYAENSSQVLEVKPTYMSVRRIIEDSHAKILKCPGNKVRELLGETGVTEDDGLGPKPSEGRQLLIDKFLDLDPPDEKLLTDTFDELIENDIRTLVRTTASFHILSLPGSCCTNIKSDAALLWEFGRYACNGDGNMENVDSIKDLRDIIRTRRGQMELIYSRKVLEAVLVHDEQQRRPRKAQRLAQAQRKRKVNDPQRWPPGAVRTTKTH